MSIDARSSSGQERRPARAIALMLLAMFLLAAMDGTAKVLARTHAIWQILWVRYVFFALLAAAMLGGRGGLARLRSRRPWLQAVRAALLVLENGVFVLAFTFLPLADVHAIAAVSPLLVVALSVPLLGEKVDAPRWLAVLAGFVGVLAIVRPGFKTIDWPILVALSGALMWALYQVLAKICAEADGSTTTWGWTALVGLLMTSLVGPFVWTAPTATEWALLVAVAALGAGAHYALIKALGYADATALQPFSYGLLVFAAMISVFVFGDIPDFWTIIGATVVIAAGLYAWSRERGVRPNAPREGCASPPGRATPVTSPQPAEGDGL
ncbi:MAG: DMT family transporter [Proteobacteria bacterium]|nr:DMT family transporter [Pseudomonadota bacterium]